MIDLVSTLMSYALPLTGGTGNVVVTAIGVSMAGISILLIAYKIKAGRKAKGKQKR